MVVDKELPVNYSNVWEYLGLPTGHRDEDHITQYVKTHAEVPESKIKWPRIAQVKKDGVYSLIPCVNGKSAVFGRTGKSLTSLQHHKPNFDRVMINCVFIAELCCDQCSLEELSGMVNPKRVNPLTPEQQVYLDNTYFAFHDILSLSEFVEGKSIRPYNRRYTTLGAYLSQYKMHGEFIASTVVHNEEEADAFADARISEGEEGAVFKEIDGGWTAGKQNEVQTKKVKGVDYDLLVLGIGEGLPGKHQGMVGYLNVQWRAYGKPTGDVQVLPVDGCFTQAMRKLWWDDPTLIVGSIVHVHALQIGSKGSLRLPKVKSVRIDKTKPDL